MVEHKCYVYTEAIDSRTCDEIVNLGLSQIEINATTGGDASKHNRLNSIPSKDKTLSQLKEEGVDLKNVHVRDSKISWIQEKWVFDLIKKWIDKANCDAGWNFDLDFMEPIQFTKYENNGFYGWHIDSNGDCFSEHKPYIHGVTNVPLKADGSLPDGYVLNDNRIGRVRKLSFILNLIDGNEYEGGDILFDLGNHNPNGQVYKNDMARKKGTIIVFPSFIYHCVTPVTKGKRMSLVNWCLGRPFK
jgi:PKHD-type hydroxylase